MVNCRYWMVSSGEDWVRDSSDGRLKLKKKKKKYFINKDYQGDVKYRGTHTNYLLQRWKYPQKKNNLGNFRARNSSRWLDRKSWVAAGDFVGLLTLVAVSEELASDLSPPVIHYIDKLPRGDGIYTHNPWMRMESPPPLSPPWDLRVAVGALSREKGSYRLQLTRQVHTTRS